jgi:hypothetical protein
MRERTGHLSSVVRCTEAVTLFYKQVQMRHGLPFTVEVTDEELDTWQREEIKKGLEEMRTGKNWLTTLILSSAGRFGNENLLD